MAKADVEKSPFKRRQTTRKQDTDRLFGSCNLDLDPMTLTNLYSQDVYAYKNNLLCQGFQKLEHYGQTDRQTHRQMRVKILPRHICG